MLPQMLCGLEDIFNNNIERWVYYNLVIVLKIWLDRAGFQTLKIFSVIWDIKTGLWKKIGF